MGATETMSSTSRRRCGSVLVRGLIHRLRARDELMPIEHALALAAAMARRIDDVTPAVVTPSSVLMFFDGTVELVEAWAGTVDDLGYVPPEQLLPGNPEIAVAGAVFGVGAILFELLTGRPAFVRDGEATTRYAVLCDQVLLASSIRPELPDEIDEIIVTAVDKDHDRRYACGTDLARAIEDAAMRAGLTLAVEEVGKLGKRLAHGVRLAHTVRSPEVSFEDRSTRRMRITDLLRLGVDVEREPPVSDVDLLAFDLGEDDEDDEAVSLPSEGLSHTFFIDDDPETEDCEVPGAENLLALPLPAAVAPKPAPARQPRAKTTDQIRHRDRGRYASGLAALVLVLGTVAWVAVPVFPTDDSVAGSPGVTAPRPVDQPAANGAQRASTPGAVAATPVGVVPGDAVRVPVHPRAFASTAAATSAVHDAMKVRDWLGAATACGHILGQTRSRRVKATCAIASCRADQWSQHTAFLDGLSRSRRAAVARQCASATATGPST